MTMLDYKKWEITKLFKRSQKNHSNLDSLASNSLFGRYRFDLPQYLLWRKKEVGMLLLDKKTKLYIGHVRLSDPVFDRCEMISIRQSLANAVLRDSPCTKGFGSSCASLTHASDSLMSEQGWGYS
jgi:hypothetical protein